MDSGQVVYDTMTESLTTGKPVRLNFSRDPNADLFRAPFAHPVSQVDGGCLPVVPRATACAGIAWLSHKRRLRTEIVWWWWWWWWSRNERSGGGRLWWRQLSQEDRPIANDRSGGEGPCSKARSGRASGVIGEKERDRRGGGGETEPGEIEVGQ